MTSTEKRNLAVSHMKSRIKKNSYTNGGNRTYFFGYPDNKPGNTSQKGYSDCSAAVMKAIQAAAGISIGSNTNAQIQNRAKGKIVDETTGYYPNESRLLPGDCLYFKGNTSHTLSVGHVEMYIGNGQCIGHGGGTGPIIHNLKSYCKSRASSAKRYFIAVRWIPDDGSEPERNWRELSKGDYGDDVTEMQNMLLSLGYDLGSYGADGDFGSATDRAVRAFQKNNALDVDGVCGEKTWTALLKLVEAKGDNEESDQPVVAETATGNLTVAPGTWNLRTGPGENFAIAQTISGGATLQEVKTDWVPVLVNGRVLWCAPKAIQK